jgi:hypothetical protein
VTRDRFAIDLAAEGSESGIKRKRAVPEVLELVPFHAPRTHGKHRIQSIQGLDMALLVQAEYSRMLRGIDVEPDDVGCLALEAESLETM